ncbi:MAG: hypothetical protein ACREIT_07015, partial [Tepidisphaeraceae bacterium]
GQGTVGSAFGAAGSLAIILVWIYYSAQILFLGAEFTQVYAQRRGRAVEPSENAEKVTEADRAQQGLRRRPESASPAARIGTIRGNRLATARPVPFALQRATDADDRNQRSRYTSWVMLAVGAVAGRWLMPKKQKRATLTGEQLRVRVATRLRELGVDPGDPRTLDPRRVADQLLPGKSILSEPWWLRAARKLNQKVHATARAVHHEPTMSEQMRHTYERSKKQARREAEEFLHI